MNVYLCLSMAAVCWAGVVEACEHYGDEACLRIKPIEGRHFLNQWIVEIEGGEDTAKLVARETGFKFMEPASDRENHFFFTHSEIPRRHKMQHNESLTILRSHEKVLSVGQQYVWKPILSQLEDYKEFVGYEEPVNVVVSTFDPRERMAYYEELMNRSIQPVYEDEVKTKVTTSSNRPSNKKATVPKLPPLEKLIDFEAMYALKEKMKTETNQNLANKSQ